MTNESWPSCAGGGHYYHDAEGRQYEAGDTSVMLGQLASGGIVKIRVDMQLQGTDGSYESARAPGERNRIWLRSHSRGRGPELEWRELDDLGDRFTPERWRRPRTAAPRTGRGGGDLLVLDEFGEALRNNRRPAIDIDRPMDITLPGLVSQESAHNGSRWLAVPDSREWA